MSYHTDDLDENRRFLGGAAIFCEHIIVGITFRCSQCLVCCSEAAIGYVLVQVPKYTPIPCRTPFLIIVVPKCTPIPPKSGFH
jgi:hypothetical protein